MIMSDFENLYNMYFFACLIKNQQEKTQDQKKTFKIHNKSAKSVHYLIDIKKFMNNKLENKLEINNVFFKFEISFIFSSEFEKKTSEDSFNFLKNTLNQVNKKLIFNF